MASRLDLQMALETVFGSENVYYQPPAGLRLSYPCIKYKLSDVSKSSANNKAYRLTKKYQLTVISREPDEPVIMKLMTWPHCTFDRQYESDNLYHDVLNLYY